MTVEDKVYNVPTIIRRWRTGLFNRKQEIIKEDKLKEKKDKMLNDDMKTLAAKENNQIMRPLQFLGMDGKYIFHHTETSRKYFRPQDIIYYQEQHW